METQNIITVFISSPSDVPSERAIVEEVMQDVNNLKGNSLGYSFKAITWEQDVLPTLGATPQEIIDENVGDNYDVFLGLMSTKFGTPTKEAGSGTEHEFNRAYERKVNNPADIEVMFYFQEPGHSGKKIDFKELEKIENFKSSITDKGLYVPYTTIEEFKTSITNHLAKLMDKIVAKHKATNSITIAHKASPPKSAALFDPMSILNAVEDDDEQGFIEIAENAVNSLGLATEQLSSLTDAMTRLGKDIAIDPFKLEAMSPQEKMNRATDLLKKSGRSMDSYVETSSAILPLFHRHLTDGLQLSRDLIIIGSQDGMVEKADIDGFQVALEHMKHGMERGLEGFVGLSESLSGLPRATTAFNRSRKRIKAVVDGISNLITSAIQEVDDIIKTINA